MRQTLVLYTTTSEVFSLSISLIGSRVYVVIGMSQYKSNLKIQLILPLDLKQNLYSTVHTVLRIICVLTHHKIFCNSACIEK